MTHTGHVTSIYPPHIYIQRWEGREPRIFNTVLQNIRKVLLGQAKGPSSQASYFPQKAAPGKSTSRSWRHPYSPAITSLKLLFTRIMWCFRQVLQHLVAMNPQTNCALYGKSTSFWLSWTSHKSMSLNEPSFGTPPPHNAQALIIFPLFPSCPITNTIVFLCKENASAIGSFYLPSFAPFPVL